METYPPEHHVQGNKSTDFARVWEHINRFSRAGEHVNNLEFIFYNTLVHQSVKIEY